MTIAPSLRLDPASTAATIETTSGSSLPTTIDDPETITGDKIGDRADPKRSPPGAGPDGTINLADVPEWISVSRDGVVVGYVKKADLYSSPDSPSDTHIGEPIPVYDNQGSQIGVLGANGFVPNSG